MRIIAHTTTAILAALLCGCLSQGPGLQPAERFLGFSVDSTIRPAKESDLPFWGLDADLGERQVYHIKTRIAERTEDGMRIISSPSLTMRAGQRAVIPVGGRPNAQIGCEYPGRWDCSQYNAITGALAVTVFRTNSAVVATLDVSVRKVPIGTTWVSTMTLRLNDETESNKPPAHVPLDAAPGASSSVR